MGTFKRRVGLFHTFGSQSYIVEPNTDHPKSPIIIEDFPYQGCTAKIEIGRFPEWLGKL